MGEGRSGSVSEVSDMLLAGGGCSLPLASSEDAFRFLFMVGLYRLCIELNWEVNRGWLS